MVLAERKHKILSAVVESYIKYGEPIGSKSLINETGLKASSATVRNEMADLTNMGFLTQPHTSAGRIPTRQAYRYYIDYVMKPRPISDGGRYFIETYLYERADSPENILRGASQLVCEFTDLIGAATTPDGENSRIHRLSFVQTGAHTAMVILVASNGVIKTKLFRCEFLITPEILEVFDKALNDVFSGIRLRSVNRPFIQTAAAKFGEISLLMPSVLTAVMEAAKSAGEISVCHSGFTKLISLEELDIISARRMFDFLTNEHDFSSMLMNLPQSTSVLLGNENSRTELAESAVVSTRYSVDSGSSGVLAAIGPLRMNYARTIPILECIAECVGRLIGELAQI